MQRTTRMARAGLTIAGATLTAESPEGPNGSVSVANGSNAQASGFARNGRTPRATAEAVDSKSVHVVGALAVVASESWNPGVGPSGLDVSQPTIPGPGRAAGGSSPRL